MTYVVKKQHIPWVYMELTTDRCYYASYQGKRCIGAIETEKPLSADELNVFRLSPETYLESK